MTNLSLKINTNQTRTGKTYLFRTCYTKGVSQRFLHFGRNSKVGQGNEKVLQWGPKEGFQYAFIGGWWQQKAGG